MDEGGLAIPLLHPKRSTVIKFRATITATGIITNVVDTVGFPGVSAIDVVDVPASGGPSTCTLKLTNSCGAEVNYEPGDGIYVTVPMPMPTPTPSRYRP